MENVEELEKFANDLFRVDLDTLIAAIKLSPNAQGYLSGAITEIELKKYLESKGYEVFRIKEKWEGDKHENHCGDFYVRKKGTKEWFVLESKGVKSNSEKWHKLFNKQNLIQFLKKYIDLTPFKNEKEIVDYIDKNLPLFNIKYKDTLYTWNDIQKYKLSNKETEKSKIMDSLKKISLDDLERLISERLNYVMKNIRVLETHFVSGGTGSKKSKRTQATPRKDEFNIMSLDLVLRTGNHKFLFANPNRLEPSASDKNHLQQNYIIGIIIKGNGNELIFEKPWTDNFNEVFSTLKKPVKEEDMQIDHRADAIEEETLEKLK
jgi:hypothetical protein